MQKPEGLEAPTLPTLEGPKTWQPKDLAQRPDQSSRKVRDPAILSNLEALTQHPSHIHALARATHVRIIQLSILMPVPPTGQPATAAVTGL